MSNRENPCSGYLIEASKLAALVPDAHRRGFHDALDEHDFDKALSILEESVPANSACPSQIFVLGDTDTGDGDLEQDIPYAYFDESDLYERREKRGLVRFRQLVGEAPAAHSWTIWG